MLREAGPRRPLRVHPRAGARDALRRRSPSCAARGCTAAWGRRSPRLRGPDLDPHLPQLAHHFAQAAPVEQPERAIDFALAAARRADRLLAWEEAAEHYRARAARARARGRATTTACAASCCSRSARPRTAPAWRRPRARPFRGRRRDRARARRRRRCSAARRSASPARGRCSAAPTRRASALLEEALAALGADGQPAARPPARPARARALLLRRPGAAARAVRGGGRARPRGSATRARSPSASTPATTRCGGRRPSNERLEVAAELRRVAEQTGDPELELEGAGWTVVDLLELGDVQGADVQIAAASKLAEALHRPIWLWWTSLLRCTRAQLDGQGRPGAPEPA